MVSHLNTIFLANLCLSAFIALEANAYPGADSNSAPAAPPPAAQASAPGTPPLSSVGGDSRYVKQVGVIDTAPATPSGAKTRTRQPSLAEIKDDFAFMGAISGGAWEGLAPQKFSLSRNALVGSDAKVADEIQGKQAAMLVEYGCIEAISRRFKAGQRYCDASLFRFSSPDGAFGAYSTMRNGSSTVVVRGQATSEDDNSITFFSGNALVCLHAAEDDDEGKGLLSKLADQIAPHLSSGTAPLRLPDLLLSLPRMDRLAGSEKYFMGSQAACRYSSVQFLDELMLNQCRGAVYADYLYPRPRAERLKLFIAAYGNQANAQSAFDSYTAAMSSYAHKMLNKSNNQALAKMSDSYLMCGMSGAKVWVISGARRATSPALLALELLPRQ